MKVSVFLALCVVASANVIGRDANIIGQDANRVGRDVSDALMSAEYHVQNAISTAADFGRSFVTSTADLREQYRQANQETIAKYERGEISSADFWTQMSINDYQYEQAVQNRLRSENPWLPWERDYPQQPYQTQNYNQGYYPNSNNQGNYQQQPYQNYNQPSNSNYDQNQTKKS